MLYFVTFDGIPFACGPDQEFWCTAYDQAKPREYDIPDEAMLVSKERFDELVSEQNA